MTTGRSFLGVIAPRVLAAIAWSAVLLQLWLSLANGKTLTGGFVAYSGYFTVLTNWFVALVCTAGSIRQNSQSLPSLYRLPMVGCSTAAILVVGVSYHFLLRKTWAPQGAQLVADIVLHYIVPCGALLHWLVYRHAQDWNWSTPLSWCWYPVLYFVYVMVRGEILSAYPYPFIDVLTLGYAQTLVNALGLLLAFIVVGYALLGIERVIAKRTVPELST